MQKLRQYLKIFWVSRRVKEWSLFYVGAIGFILSDSIHKYTGVPKLLIGLVLLIIFCGWVVFQVLPQMRKTAQERADSKKREDELK